MFCAAGVAGTCSSPRLDVIRPYSSKAAEFISSCDAFGSILTFTCGPLRVSKRKVSPPCWAIRAKPSHLLVAFWLVQSPLATNDLP